MGDGLAAGPIYGAFAPPGLVRGLDADAGRVLVGRLAEAGLTHLLTEGPDLPAWLTAAVRSDGLRLGGGMACFSDHAYSIAPVADALRPVAADGHRRPQMEWYRGIIPTDDGYEDALVAACRRTVEQRPLDMFVLDFIRWPIHWELELRDGSAVAESSYQPITLRRFSEEAGVDVDVDDPASAARLIGEHHADAWVDFKCAVITAIVNRVAAEVRAARPDLAVGAFVIPGTEEQRRHAGQDVAAMAAQIDLLLPMTYHAILHRPPEWVGDIVVDMRRRAPGAAVTPVVQATADRTIAGGWDWGPPFPPAELGRAIAAGLGAGGDGFIVFPAHGLDGPRLEQVRAALERTYSSL